MACVVRECRAMLRGFREAAGSPRCLLAGGMEAAETGGSGSGGAVRSCSVQARLAALEFLAPVTETAVDHAGVLTAWEGALVTVRRPPPAGEEGAVLSCGAKGPGVEVA